MFAFFSSISKNEYIVPKKAAIITVVITPRQPHNEPIAPKRIMSPSPMASLPNIITGKDLVPEFIQFNVKAEKIGYEIEKMLYIDEYKNNKNKLTLVKLI